MLMLTLMLILMFMLMLMLMQSFYIPGVWRLGWGAVRDEAGEMDRAWAAGTWWARLGSMDQSQGTVPRVRLVGLKEAPEFKSWCLKGDGILGFDLGCVGITGPQNVFRGIRG